MVTALVRHSRQPTIPTTTSTIVAYGCDSARIPGISPRRRRGSAGAGGRLRRRSVTRPSRSILGARLRSLLPQYGHSVMYGLTSDPQLLQTTNSSGLPVLIRGPIVVLPRCPDRGGGSLRT